MNEQGLTWTTHESPIGQLTLIAGATGIRSLKFPGHAPQLEQDARRRMRGAIGQLDAYFAGERRTFTLELELNGTPLQEAVWEQLLAIPYGTTTTYGALAGRIDDALYPAGLQPYRRARLIGAAVARTPTPILVPCHRVLGADGSLTGYLGGLQRKQALLDLERRGAGDQPPEPTAAGRQLALL